MLISSAQRLAFVVIFTCAASPARSVVLDAPGEPVSHAGRVLEKGTLRPVQAGTVTVTRFVWPDPATGGRRVLQKTTHRTDAAGNYRFALTVEQMAEPRLAVFVSVEHPEFVRAERYYYEFANVHRDRTDGDRPSFDIEVSPGKPITGVVETPDGKPAVGVPIRYSSHAYPGQTHAELFTGYRDETRTDDHGRFRIVLLTPGRAVLKFLPTAFAVAVRELNESERGDIGRLVLRKGTSLTGRVIDADGTPIAGVMVNATGFAREPQTDVTYDRSYWDGVGSFSRTTVTDRLGEFTLEPLPSGFYRVMPIVEDCGGVGISVYHPLPVPFVPMRVSLKDGDAPAPIEIRALEHVTIEAKFRDTLGNPGQGPHPIVRIGGGLDLDKRGRARPRASLLDALIPDSSGPTWSGVGWPDVQGNIVIRVPRGLRNAVVSLNELTDDHHVVRHRLGREPVRKGEIWNMGLITRDIKDIELISYDSPTLLVRARARDGSKTKGVHVAGWYRDSVTGGLEFGMMPDVEFEPRPDGRYRSRRLLPDEPVTVSIEAYGYETRFEKFTLSASATEEIDVVFDKKEGGPGGVIGRKRDE